MSTIDSQVHRYSANSSHSSGQTAASNRKNPSELTAEKLTLDLEEDRVEISPGAFEMLYTRQRARSEQEKEDFSDTVRALMEKLSASKKDLDGHINAVLKNNGIRLAPSEKLRVETTAGGRIAVSGIEDKQKRKAIEEALNKESGLGKKILDFKAAKRKLDSNLNYELGKNSAELFDELDGKAPPISDIIERKDNLGQYQLFAENDDLVDMMKELNSDSNISIVTGAAPNANPEGTLVKSMNKTRTAINDGMLQMNKKFLAELGDAAKTMTQEEIDQYMLDPAAVTYTVGSDGSIVIDGDLCADSRRNEMGKEFIEGMLKEMMEEKDESGEVEIFKEACDRLLDDYQDKFGDEAATDARVLVEVGAKNPAAAVRLSSPSKEKELKEGINVEVNALLRDQGIDTETPFEVEVDNDGKLKITNLPENKMEREKVLQALEVINTGILKDEEDPTYGKLTRLVNHSMAFKWGGTDEIYKDQSEITEVVETPYSPAVE